MEGGRNWRVAVPFPPWISEGFVNVVAVVLPDGLGAKSKAVVVAKFGQECLFLHGCAVSFDGLDPFCQL